VNFALQTSQNPQENILKTFSYQELDGFIQRFVKTKRNTDFNYLDRRHIVLMLHPVVLEDNPPNASIYL
jgi:hypothetical protein